jgi:ribosomal protein L39E
MIKMARNKPFGKKIKLIAARKQSAPRWADIRKYSLKRARSRRIRVPIKHWRRGKIKP